MSKTRKIRSEVGKMIAGLDRPYGKATPNLEETIEKGPGVIKRLRYLANNPPKGPGLKPSAKKINMRGKRPAVEYLN